MEESVIFAVCMGLGVAAVGLICYTLLAIVLGKIKV